MGTLAYSERHEGTVLQQELTVLSCFLSFPLVEIPDTTLAARPLHSQFSYIEISTEAGRMAQAGDNTGIMDIKKNLRHLYEMVAIGVMDNKEIA